SISGTICERPCPRAASTLPSTCSLRSATVPKATTWPSSRHFATLFVPAAACWLTLRTETWWRRAFPAEQSRRNVLQAERSSSRNPPLIPSRAVNTTWYWSGRAGQGHKSASLRLYTATELVRLLQSAGLRFLSAHRGCSLEPFRAEGPDLGGPIALLTERA